MKSEDLSLLRAGLLVAAVGGVSYFVLDGLQGGTEFLIGDALLFIGLGMAARKIRAIGQAPWA